MSVKLNSFLTRSGVDAIRSGNPWILAGQLKPTFKASLPSSPALVPLGEHWFWYSPASEIRLRRMGPATRYWPSGKEQGGIITSLEEFSSHFATALSDELALICEAKQRALGGERSLRWIFGDCDGFGGLVLDLFDNCAVAQLQSAPIEFFWPVLKECLSTAWQRVCNSSNELEIVEHRDGAVRAKEGLAIIPFEVQEREMVLRWNGLNWSFNPAGNQKTGAYLDQKDNHLRALSWAQRLNCRRAWDVCCFEGGFGIHLASAGIEVLAVDSSQAALARVYRNAELNDCTATISAERSDAFEFLRRRHAAEERVDMIVLDPPALAPDKKSIPQALKAYRELNLRAVHCLRPGGLLVSCSCSHVFHRQHFLDMLAQVEHHTRRKLRLLELCGPASDHSAALQLEQSDYLQAYFIQVL